MNTLSALGKLNFKQGEVALRRMSGQPREEPRVVFVGVSLIPTLLWNSAERKCRAPSGNVSPSSSDRASNYLEADSRPT